MNLNLRTASVGLQLESQARTLRIALSRTASGTLLIDCGVETRGSLEAGRLLAETCMAALGQVSFTHAGGDHGSGPAVQVRTDHPVAACMAAQYAGWEIKGNGYFAMGSGPMRAASAHEELFTQIGCREQPSICYGVLESASLPPDEICREIATKCRIQPPQLTLLIAPTRSLAGMVQIVSRSIETALHKLHELGFDLSQVVSGFGIAPLPPPARDDLAAIGRTNDAILYGGEVTLYVLGDDDALEVFGPRTPSSASADYGRPFAETFASYGHDFYKIDPHLFSPAVITFANLQTGNSFRFGQFNAEVLAESFGTKRPATNDP